MKYQMERADGVVERLVQRDVTAGVVYVYTKYPDRWDVHKFASIDLVTATVAEGEELLSVTAPLYRVTAGECTCPGFEYRGQCRHSLFVTGRAEG